MNMFNYRFPFRPRIRLTSFCNQKCKYCFAVDYLSSQKQEREIPLHDLEKILIMCKNEGIGYIAWQGGEPLLHSKLEEIIKLHEKYSVKAMIFTNGTFTSRIIPQLKHIIHSVLVNCNAPDTYDKKDLETIHDNVFEMKKQFGDNRVAIGINIYTEDLDTSYILNYARNMNVQEVRVDITRPAPSHENSFIDYNRVSVLFQKAYSTVKMLYNNGITKVHFDCPFPLCLLNDDEKFGLWNFMYDDIKMGQCRTYLDITTNMNISSCFCSIPFTDIPLSLFSSLTHAWQFIKNIEDDLRWNQPTKESCEQCSLWETHQCQGGCLGYKVDNKQYIDNNYVNSHFDLLEYSKKVSELFILFHKSRYSEFIEQYKNIENRITQTQSQEMSHLYIVSRILSGDESVTVSSLMQNLKNTYSALPAALDYACILHDNMRLSDAIAIAYEGIALAEQEKYKAYKLYEFLHKTIQDNIESKKCLIQYYKLAPLALKRQMIHR
mgnify:FL=1